MNIAIVLAIVALCLGLIGIILSVVFLVSNLRDIRNHFSKIGTKQRNDKCDNCGSRTDDRNK